MDVLLIMTSTDGHKRVFHITKDASVIGRAHSCDLRLPLPSVAMKHSEITVNEAGVGIRNLDSEHSTIVNDKEIEHTYLQDGDRLGIGPVHFEVHIAEVISQHNNKHDVEIETKATLDSSEQKKTLKADSQEPAKRGKGDL